MTEIVLLIDLGLESEETNCRVCGYDADGIDAQLRWPICHRCAELLEKDLEESGQSRLHTRLKPSVGQFIAKVDIERLRVDGENLSETFERHCYDQQLERGTCFECCGQEFLYYLLFEVSEA